MVSLVMVSDGKERCGGDPCAAARRLCVAHPTGGQVLIPAKAEEFDPAAASAATGGCP